MESTMTTTTDYRAALSDLADRLENWNSAKPHHDDMEAVRSARALLAAPEAVKVADAGHSVADYMRSEIDVVESCAGFTDESTPVGDAWSRILGAMERSRYGTAHPAPVPVADPR